MAKAKKEIRASTSESGSIRLRLRSRTSWSTPADGRRLHRDSTVVFLQRHGHDRGREGKLDHRPVNFEWKDDMIVGSVLWCGTDGDEFADCPYSLEEFRKRWPWLFEEG